MTKFIGWALVLASLFFGLRPAQAAWTGEFGQGFDHPKADASHDRVKYVEFGYSKSHRIFESAFNLGGWTDCTGYQGALNSGFVSAELGLETRQPGFYVNYFLGPSYITTPDSLLGSHLQIAHELGLGYKDTRGVGIGLVVKHWSDAGTSAVNYGRNFVGVRARFQ